METLAALLVGKPLNILLVAAVWLLVCLAPRAARPGDRARQVPFVVTSAAWGLYAAWEWLVQTRTPEADIRVDLLLIWPALGALSAWALYRVLRAP